MPRATRTETVPRSHPGPITGAAELQFTRKLCFESKTRVWRANHALRFGSTLGRSWVNKVENSRLQLALLGCGVAFPIVYFGVQLIAAPFYPGYSFLTDDASTLGSDGSQIPAIFNVASMMQGVLLLLAAPAVVTRLRSTSPKLVWVLLFAFLAGSAACFNAGIYPLPDPRHVSGALAGFGSFFFVLPLVLPFLFRSDPSARRFRTYAWANVAVMLSLIPIVSGLIQRVAGAWSIEMPRYQEFLNSNFGIIQRMTAAVIIVPVGVLSWRLLSSPRSDANAPSTSRSRTNSFETL